MESELYPRKLKKKHYICTVELNHIKLISLGLGLSSGSLLYTNTGQKICGKKDSVAIYSKKIEDKGMKSEKWSPKKREYQQRYRNYSKRNSDAEE